MPKKGEVKAHLTHRPGNTQLISSDDYYIDANFDIPPSPLSNGQKKKPSAFSRVYLPRCVVDSCRLFKC